MLNKLQIALIVGAGLQILRVILPNVELPEGLTEAVVDLIWLVIMLVGMAGAGWKVKESRAKVEALQLKD